MTAPPEGRRAPARAAAWLALACVLWLAGGAAQAQVPRGNPGGPHWQQRLQRWDNLPRQRRQAILREQQRYRRLSPREQQRLFEQYRRRRR